MFSSIQPEVIGVMIPIVALFGGVIIAIVAIIAGAKTKELKHKEKIVAMEKGIELPEETVKERPVHAGRRAAGMVFVGLGLSLTIAIWVAAGAIGGVWGLVPLFIGIGLLIAAAIDKKEYQQNKLEERAQ